MCTVMIDSSASEYLLFVSTCAIPVLALSYQRIDLSQNCQFE